MVELALDAGARRDREIVAEALAAVDGAYLAEREYTHLSGGERQRVHLARVLEQKNAASGIASLCIGGGQGGAMLLERSVA